MYEGKRQYHFPKKFWYKWCWLIIVQFVSNYINKEHYIFIWYYTVIKILYLLICYNYYFIYLQTNKINEKMYIKGYFFRVNFIKNKIKYTFVSFLIIRVLSEFDLLTFTSKPESLLPLFSTMFHFLFTWTYSTSSFIIIKSHIDEKNNI